MHPLLDSVEVEALRIVQVSARSGSGLAHGWECIEHISRQLQEALLVEYSLPPGSLAWVWDIVRCHLVDPSHGTHPKFRHIFHPCLLPLEVEHVTGCINQVDLSNCLLMQGSVETDLGVPLLCGFR